MTKKERNHVNDLRGVSRLAVDATERVTSVVEAMHRTIAGGPAILGRPLAGPSRLITGVVYGSIRGVTKLVGASIDAVLSQLTVLTPGLSESVPGPEREALLAVLNGVVGDYLSETNNPLAIKMRLRRGGAPLLIERHALSQALPSIKSKIVVLVHGSCMNDAQWCNAAPSYGELLEQELGYTALYLHYNSGLHISENGEAFAVLLEQLATEWPVPLDELVLIGHSMGGLVSRSACHSAELAGQAWRSKLRALICLGSPHQGAPLERGGNRFETLLGVSRYSAPLAQLGKLRSAGVTDLRFGNVLHEHWAGHDRFSRHDDPRKQLTLPSGVRSYAIAATRTPKPGGRLLSDGLVPVNSALGLHKRPDLSLDFPQEQQWVAFGVGHVELLHQGEVYAKIREWLARL